MREGLSFAALAKTEILGKGREKRLAIWYDCCYMVYNESGKLWLITKAQTNQMMTWLVSPEGQHELVYSGRKIYFLFATCGQLFLLCMTVFLQCIKTEWG